MPHTTKEELQKSSETSHLGLADYERRTKRKLFLLGVSLDPSPLIHSLPSHSQPPLSFTAAPPPLIHR